MNVRDHKVINRLLADNQETYMEQNKNPIRANNILLDVEDNCHNAAPTLPKKHKPIWFESLK